MCLFVMWSYLAMIWCKESAISGCIVIVVISNLLVVIETVIAGLKEKQSHCSLWQIWKVDFEFTQVNVNPLLLSDDFVNHELARGSLDDWGYCGCSPDVLIRAYRVEVGTLYVVSRLITNQDVTFFSWICGIMLVCSSCNGQTMLIF